MFKVDAGSYGTSKNNFVNSANHYKELDALTGKRINSITQLFFRCHSNELFAEKKHFI